MAVFYNMVGLDADSPTLTIRKWTVSGQPDTTGALYTGPKDGASPLTNITVASTYDDGRATDQQLWSPVQCARAALGTWSGGNYTAGHTFYVPQQPVVCVGVRVWTGYTGTKNIKFSLWNPSNAAVIQQTVNTISGTPGQVYTHIWSSPQTLFRGTGLWKVSAYDTGGTHYAYVTGLNPGLPTAPTILWINGDQVVTSNGFAFGGGDSAPVSGGYAISSGEFYVVEPIFRA